MNKYGNGRFYLHFKYTVKSLVIYHNYLSFPSFIFAEKNDNILIQRSTTNSTHKQHLAVFHLGYTCKNHVLFSSGFWIAFSVVNFGKLEKKWKKEEGV